MQTQPLHNYKQPTTSTNNKTKHMQQQISKYQQQSNTCKHTCKPLPKKEQLQNKQTHAKPQNYTTSLNHISKYKQTQTISNTQLNKLNNQWHSYNHINKHMQTTIKQLPNNKYNNYRQQQQTHANTHINNN